MRSMWKRFALILFVLFALLAPVSPGSGAFAQGSGILRLTLRGCPEGTDPTAISATSAQQACVTPLDAPDAAGIHYGGDGQGGEEVRFMEREYDGTYHTQVPANKVVNLFGFEPTVRDSYMMTNVGDTDSDGDFDVQVPAGETVSIRVYYYNAGSSSGGATGTALYIKFRACPDNVDATEVNPFAVCTIPLDAPDASVVVWDGENVRSIPDFSRQYDGTYEFFAPDGLAYVSLVDLDPVLRNAYIVFGATDGPEGGWGVDLAPGEGRHVFVFYYYE